jgi:hypothetical protein
MKVIWHPTDIRGRALKQPPTSRTFHILYNENDWKDRRNTEDNRWGLVDLADGLVVRSGLQKSELADFLTEHGFVPAELRMSEDA